MRELETAKAKIEDSERCFKNLFNSMRDVIIMADNEHCVVNVNQPAMRDVLGYELDEIVGQKTSLFYADEQGYEEAGRKIFFKNEPVAGLMIETRFKRKNGEIFFGEMLAMKLLDDQGKISGNVGIIRDITDRKKLEVQLRQAQKMEAVGTLAGGIAHDFNNILTALIGYTELARMELPPGADKAQADLREVFKAGGRASDLVKQILTFSRQGEQELKPLRIQYIVKEALKLMRSSLPTTIEIRQDIDGECAPVLADPTQIHQVLMNLCTNAYHAMRGHGGVLGVTLKPVEISDAYANRILDLGPGKYLKLEISDNGSGIETADVEKIFEPYFTTKKKGEGTGLGLSMVHGIVKRHGGHISVYSEPGQGTTFKIYLPLYESPGLVADLDKKAGGGLPHGTERLLVVDDEASIIDVDRRILEGLGYQVTAVTGSEEAARLFAKQPDAFDLVMTDMTMPDMTGLELARKLLAVRADIPIILCSGFSEIVNEQIAKAAGIKEYLMKPVDRKSLAKAIRKALGETPAAAKKDGEK